MHKNVSRRGFIQVSAAAAFAALLPAYGRAHGNHGAYAARLGFQSYTVRDPLEKDPRGTLKRVAALGYKEVELYDPAHAALFAPITRDLGLDMVSSHIPGLFSEDKDWSNWIAAGRPLAPAGYDLNGILKIAQKHHLRYIGYPHGAPDQAYASAENYRLYVDLLDRIGAMFRKSGIIFFYHNHHHEFAKVGSGTFFDIMVNHSNPDHLAIELDVCWLAHAGQNPAAMISRLGKRAPLIHLKDRKPGIATATGPGWPKTDIFAEVGSGALDIPGILRAAHKAGVSHVFVEQDSTPGDPVLSLAKSYAYVQKVGL